ncbi:hypothetical protein [Phytomonospora endophytica]|uniref:Mce-associated membrane protein n=1 Tax=Phytomonospora endophytica TaxID=714109 RepID=A0A841FNJ4_9ACTN|nr:hypothetical protein [Phytomonospora endophytica]MBB6037414.1 Mce-associated membrane protein [Phytomonospora endophytica]GIG69843.1 hypothetical protein Pen01_61380 [Phytomonospora endophytica]
MEKKSVFERRPLWIGLNIVLLLIVLAALGLGGYSGWKFAAAEQNDGVQADALAAARQHVDGFMTTSSGSVDADLDRIEAAATGEFKEQWIKNEAALRESIVANQATSNGEILSAAVVDDSPDYPTDHDSVGVIVAADATVTNVNAPEGRLVHYRVIVGMTLVDGKWLIGKLGFVE